MSSRKMKIGHKATIGQDSQIMCIRLLNLNSEIRFNDFEKNNRYERNERTHEKKRGRIRRRQLRLKSNARHLNSQLLGNVRDSVPEESDVISA